MINLTQHAATSEQMAAMVSDLQGLEADMLHDLLTFREIPDRIEILKRARLLAELACGSGERTAMIGGAPYLMAPFELALREKGIQAYYAFSAREVIEEPQPDGSVKKTMVFRHAGFVPGMS